MSLFRHFTDAEQRAWTHAFIALSLMPTRKRAWN